MCISKNNAVDDVEVYDDSSQKLEISQNVVVVMEPSELVINFHIFYLIIVRFKKFQIEINFRC